MKNLNRLVSLMAMMFTSLVFLFGTVNAEDGLVVNIITPTNAEITGNNNILFSFEGSYPDTHIFTNYKYEITRIRDSRIIKQQTITQSGFQSFTQDLEDGNYTFAVTLNTTNGGFTPFKKESRGFTVVDDVDLDITSPRSSTVNTTSATFSRDGRASTFDHYEYEVTSSNAPYYYSGTSNDINDDSFNLTNLLDGRYRFTVTMYYTGGHHISDYIDFTVSLSSSLSITDPAQNGTEINSSDYTFKWNGTHPYLDKFCYTLSRDGGGYTPKQNCTTSKSLSVTDLVDGTYTLKITMQNSEGAELKSATRTFSVDFNRSLNIPSINTITQKEHTFSRNGSAEDFNNYTYSLDGTTNGYHTSNTITNNNFTVSNLIDGEYTLTVIMNCDGETLTDTETFSVNLNRSLSVSSNPSGTIIRNNVTGVNVTVSWEGDNDWFNKYSYKLTKDGSAYGNPGTSTNKSDTKLYEMLPSGTYKFHIDMLNSTNGIITSGDVNFTIKIPTTLTVNTPIINTNNVTLGRTGFAENFHHYEYSLNRTDVSQQVKTGTRDGYYTGFTVPSLHYGNYTLSVNMKNSGGTTITGKNVSFQISDNLSLSTDIYSGSTKILPGDTINSRSATFTRSGQSEDLAGFYYEISGTTFKNETYKESGIQTSGIGGSLYKAGNGSISLSNLQTGKYKFTVKMLAGNSVDTAFHEKSIDFYVKVPATLTITSPSEGATITSSSAKFSWTGYSDVITRYDYKLSSESYNLDMNNFTTATSFTRNDLKNGNYTLTVWISSGGNLVAEDTIHFTVAIPPKVTGGSSGKTHYSNNLKLSLGNDSPAANEWIKLIVKIDDSYVGKVTFPKLQHYSADTEKREDIPVTSKNYVSDYSDDAKLGYIKFSSSDDGRKDLEQFIKFSKNGYYRIYAEDKDGYYTYVEFKVSGKTTTQTSTNTSENNTVSNTNTINTIIQKYIPEVYEDTSEEVYIARSCKKYTIRYSDSLNVYTSPNLNMSEYFVNKDYFKRYVDSKNKYQSGCPTNVGWISTNYADRTNDNNRYTAPNGKVYFITGQPGNFYSNELNKELKTPTSFNTIQELKYYIRDRNPLISMAALGPAN